MHRNKSQSLDHLIGDGEQLEGHVEAERLGGFEVDDDLESSWLDPVKLRTRICLRFTPDPLPSGWRRMIERLNCRLKG